MYPVDEDAGKDNEPPKLVITEGSVKPLDLEEFKEEIDIRGGYLQNLEKSVDCFCRELERVKNESLSEQKVLEKYL